MIKNKFADWEYNFYGLKWRLNNNLRRLAMAQLERIISSAASLYLVLSRQVNYTVIVYWASKKTFIMAKDLILKDAEGAKIEF